MHCSYVGWLLFIWIFCLKSVLGQVSYTIPEEMAKGSVVGNIAQDLGLDVKRLKSGKARIFTRDSIEYVELNRERGVLVIKDKIDREAICGQTTPCALHFQIILENPMEFYSINIEITDVNDNPPVFEKSYVKFKISESAVSGAKFILDMANDPDVGTNGLRTYILKPTDNFALKLHGQAGDIRNIEMVLEKPLDREQHEHLSLVLTAVDGGEPQMSGTMQILISVLDVNDNAPVFTESVYKASIKEGAPLGTIVTTVTATDADDGEHGKITYSISRILGNTQGMFDVNKVNGDLTLSGNIDYEKARTFEINIRASDEGGLVDSCKLIVDVIDVNDNTPDIHIMSKSNVISEDAKPNTVVTMINIEDADSGENGKVKCSINDDIPFALRSTSTNFFSLVTDSDLDREKESGYNISVTCSDEGVPSLSSSVTIALQILDVNDNAPVFLKKTYEGYIVENNVQGVSIFTLNAIDADWNQNARVSYILEDSSLNGVPVSSYVSVSADSGVIHAVRSFDYEQIKDFQFCVKAQDGGSPPLSSNVSVKILIQDQNDNAPQVLYPVQTGGSLVAEMVPRSSDVGYLVTKVVAVDVDSGQNAWLSYKLQKATDRALFEVGLQNGEIRTIRQVTDKDAVKQRLTVIVEDNGQPSRSATVLVNVAVADSFPEVLSEFTDFTHDKEYNDNLTFYLVLALAVVSFLFITCLVVIISVKIYRWRQSRILYHSSLPVIPYYPPRYSDTLGTGTLHNVSVKILIQDQNDNAPQVLYPVQTGGSLVAEMVPRSADVGYLVTKVVAVDVDSGQNAWLSYKLQKVTDRALFEVGLQNGEIRTIRQVTDKDAVKQRLTVIVEDNGQPSRSATVIVNVAVADSFPEVLSEFTDFTHDKEYNDNLTFYLVLALAVVSFLFITCLVVIISVKIYRWRQSRILYHSSLPVIPYYPPRYSDTLGTGTLQHVYNYEVCRTTDSRKSDCKVGNAGSQNVLIIDPSSTGTMQRIQTEKKQWDATSDGFYLSGSPVSARCSGRSATPYLRRWRKAL
uniref:Cadherin domain-containing protein n=1 Tax=Gadus morhua TaxID=8049 RepID=A0A8C5B9H0_GADMO